MTAPKKPARSKLGAVDPFKGLSPLQVVSGSPAERGAADEGLELVNRVCKLSDYNQVAGNFDLSAIDVDSEITA